MANNTNTQYFLELEGLKKYDAYLKKHIPIFGTTAYFESIQKTLIPFEGQVVVYTDFRKKTLTYESGPVEQSISAIKIGDGVHYVEDLIAIDAFYWDHINDSKIHITDVERTSWNNKVTCSIGTDAEGETLVFSKD